MPARAAASVTVLVGAAGSDGATAPVAAGAAAVAAVALAAAADGAATGGGAAGGVGAGRSIGPAAGIDGTTTVARGASASAGSDTGGQRSEEMPKALRLASPHKVIRTATGRGIVTLAPGDTLHAQPFADKAIGRSRHVGIMPAIGPTVASGVCRWLSYKLFQWVRKRFDGSHRIHPPSANKPSSCLRSRQPADIRNAHAPGARFSWPIAQQSGCCSSQRSWSWRRPGRGRTRVASTLKALRLPAAASASRPTISAVWQPRAPPCATRSIRRACRAASFLAEAR